MYGNDIMRISMVAVSHMNHNFLKFLDLPKI